MEVSFHVLTARTQAPRRAVGWPLQEVTVSLRLRESSTDDVAADNDAAWDRTCAANPLAVNAMVASLFSRIDAGEASPLNLEDL